MLRESSSTTTCDNGGVGRDDSEFWLQGKMPSSPNWFAKSWLSGRDGKLSIFAAASDVVSAVGFP